MSSNDVEPKFALSQELFAMRSPAHYEGESDKTPRDFDIVVGRLSRGDFDAVLQTLGRRNPMEAICYLLKGPRTGMCGVWKRR